MPSVAPPPEDLRVRNGIRAAVILAAIAGLFAVVSPIAGVGICLLFLAAAQGLRRGGGWAAVGAISVLLPPVLILVFSQPGIGAVCLLVAIVFTYFLLRASAVLFRQDPGRGAWPWIPVAALTMVFWLSCHPYAISGSSMERTVLAGDCVLVEEATWMFGRTPGIGDILMIRNPVDRHETMTKRVVAGPGDRIRIRAGKLFRNGENVPEPYVRHAHTEGPNFQDDFPGTLSLGIDGEAQAALRSHIENGELVIPDGRYFVLGDNRDNSRDSRDYGFLTRQDIVGSPLLVYASYEGGHMTPAAIRWRRLLSVPR